MDSKTRRPSASLVVSVIALVIAISGTAGALPGRNKVETNDIKKLAVTSKKIADGAVITTKMQDLAVTSAKLAADSVDGTKIVPSSLTGEDIADNSIGDGKLSELEIIGGSFIRVTATDGADEATARAAAPEVPLFEKGQLDLYAKCFRDAGANSVRAEVFARTSANGAILDGLNNLAGSVAFLNPGTLEIDRTVDAENAGVNAATYNESEYAVASPDGTALTGQLALAVKNGNPAVGNGLYGNGNVCLIQGTVFG